ncbi:hypothetical protein ACFPOD_10355 [Nitratireductor kimnyeongensis]|uniref:Uncharacterized protein n=1 Tax=Nitratireductor kimnyeongensis TaxID=430679 RepID=A0ABW0TA50_9HYPH|nr:hypothetical protein [Nitratireductor kimnyeongensis]QZZ36027.1 hypothetical protein KW403_02415 [Nitratireductor kimnyeongensis]
MHQSADNSIKNRLTEPSAMIAEVKRLVAQGVEMDQIAPELSKQFYIDIDLLNAVLRVMRKKMSERISNESRAKAETGSANDRAAA